MDFGAIIAWLQSIWKMIWFFKIVDQFEEGVLLRFGKYNRSLKPGLHFKWSVCEKIFTHYSKDDTILLPTQYLTTLDGKTITVRGVILYYIDDIRLFLTEVNNAQQAISDMALTLIAENVLKGTYLDCCNEKISNEISKDVRREAKKWGAYVTYVKLSGMSLSKTINLSKDTESHL